jgi:short-subunit dehydrogenase
MADDARTALVTGASSGIGLELTRLLARDKYRLAIVARRRERLDDLSAYCRHISGHEVLSIVKDLSKPEAPAEVADELRDAGFHVDVLVNNAGSAAYGHFANNDWPKERDTLQLNIATPTELTHRLLPGMISRRYGRILNVASTAAFSGLPYLAVYAATKAYLLSFSVGLAAELAGTGVTVTALCPGATDSEFAEATGAQKSQLFARKGMTPEEVAAAGYRGCMKGTRIVIPGTLNKLLNISSRLVPRRLATWTGGKMTEPVR